MDSRAELLGFVGRGVAGAERACSFARGGRVLAPVDHTSAHVVIFAVGDAELAAAVQSLVDATAPRSCSLWLHTSGRHDLTVFDAVAAAGGRRGSLHPVAPFPDAGAGYDAMLDQPAVLQGDPRALRLLGRLAEWLAMRPIVAGAGSRALYHAACALAANGLVALRELADSSMRAAGGFAPDDARELSAALMRNSLAATDRFGPAAALSGPVLRGDAATVAAHLQALATDQPGALPGYRALMAVALELAQQRGLAPEAAARIAELLD